MIVVGTAGHIDHGKTTLIRTLTGIETDRLKEEQQRGISIELGFAYLDLEDGSRVGLIDVPGHERFVHHMIAGATGVDLVLLVVAADEGVMPQTREHVAICELLGMRRGIVVLSKVDLVDAEWLELVRDDIRDYLAGTFLADAPVLPFSSTFAGGALGSFREHLYREIMAQSRQLEKASVRRPFMMPVDRVFTVKGFGTVVTGTVQSGGIRVGDSVEVLPAGLQTKVRRLEIHGQTAEESRAGTRTAANLPDVEKLDVDRGNVLVAPGTIVPVSRLTVSLSALPSLLGELKEQFKVLFHTGSAMTEASVRLLDCQRLTGGGRALAAVRLSTPLAVLPGNRYVVRGFTTMADYGKTIGGGTILWPDSVKAGETTT
ncbi:MAG: selenocysteine-specific translation elongation factor, partial [Deltaproteobacteria bacterium]|nr:selenocysteine-specific translation elongation factor [Deltaproteobacteria bacterium]